MNHYEQCLNELWESVKSDALDIAKNESILEPFLESIFFSKKCIFESISSRIARRLSSASLTYDMLYLLFLEVFNSSQSIKESVIADIIAIKKRDPACTSYIMPILYYKGFMAITTHRISHYLYENNRKHLAFCLQSLNSEVFAVDIHPAAQFGKGILLDHATSFVAGETSVVHDNVSILHEVTLGGTGNETGDRHPKIMSGVLIGAGSKIIGNITVGECAKIGAGSVVLDDVDDHDTVVGIPAKRVAKVSELEPAESMNQKFL